jgi:HPt (histidine-containing phosphotransfer) domain-containing protein
MSTLDALLGDEQRRLIAAAAEVFGQTYDSLMFSLAHQIKNTAGFVGASQEKQLAIVASRLTKL